MTMSSLLMNGAGISHILVSVSIAARNGARKHEKSLRLKLKNPIHLIKFRHRLLNG